MNNNATGKYRMSKNLSLQNFLDEASQLWVYIIAKWRRSNLTQKQSEEKKTLPINMPKFIADAFKLVYEKFI